MTHFPGKQNLRPKNIQDHAEGLAGFGLAGRLAHVSGLGFGASLLGVARFVLCDSSGQLCRAVPALFLTGVSQSELAKSPRYHGEQSGVHRAGGHRDLGWGLVLGCL